MVRDQKKIKILLIGTLTICAAIFLSSHNAYAIRYNLEEMSVFVPDRFEIVSDTANNGEKIYLIRDINTGSPFAVISYTNNDATADYIDKSIDYLKSNSNTYQEIKRGCDDGLLSINNNYCTVKYYAEDSSGASYTLQTITQIRNGISALWTIDDSNEDRLNNKINTLVNIINSMISYPKSNTEMDTSNTNQQTILDNTLRT
jgi:hypothetical protein